MAMLDERFPVVTATTPYPVIAAASGARLAPDSGPDPHRHADRDPGPACPGRFLNWRHEWAFAVPRMDEDHRSMAQLIDQIGTSFGRAPRYALNPALGKSDDAAPGLDLAVNPAGDSTPAQANGEGAGRLDPTGFGEAWMPTAEQLQRRLRQLGGLARMHFAREEQLMRAADYPDYRTHKIEHDLLLAEYTVMTREVTASGASTIDAGPLRELKAWFLGHLLDDDRRLADHLHRIGFTTWH